MARSLQGASVPRGLDPQTRNQMWEFIRALSRDEHVTVFFTTHYVEKAERVADRIAVIDHGRIVAQGTAATLRQESGGRTLEDAFIALTGHSIREAEAAPSICCKTAVCSSDMHPAYRIRFAKA